MNTRTTHIHKEMKTHHFCFVDEMLLLDGNILPYTKKEIEEKKTEVLSSLLDDVIVSISDDAVVVCGLGKAEMILRRKLEDRLGRVVG